MVSERFGIVAGDLPRVLWSELSLEANIPLVGKLHRGLMLGLLAEDEDPKGPSSRSSVASVALSSPVQTGLGIEDGDLARVLGIEPSLGANFPLVGKVHRGLRLSSFSWLRMKTRNDPAQEALLLLRPVCSPWCTGL